MESVPRAIRWWLYNAEQYSFRLDTTAAEVDSTYWNDTAPTSS